MSIETEVEAHIAAIEDAYRDAIIGPMARIEGGSRLWNQFERNAAVSLWTTDSSVLSGTSKGAIQAWHDQAAIGCVVALHGAKATQ